jgi:hypothetical protein
MSVSSTIDKNSLPLRTVKSIDCGIKVDGFSFVFHVQIIVIVAYQVDDCAMVTINKPTNVLERLLHLNSADVAEQRSCRYHLSVALVADYVILKHLGYLTYDLKHLTKF